MTQPLYVSIDIFHAAAYRAPDGTDGREDYSHDARAFYIVLQPYLVHFAGDAAASSPSLHDYLLNWTGATLAEDGALRLLDPVRTADIRARAPGVIPVPFPPGTRLSNEVQWPDMAAGAGTFLRTIGDGAGAFALTNDEWPEFAWRSFFSVRIADWNHFTESEQQRLIEWAYGLALALSSKRDRQLRGTGPALTPNEQHIYDFYVAQGPVLTKAEWDRKFENNAQVPGYLRLGTRMRDLLNHLWDPTRPWNLVDAAPAGEVSMQPPSFRYDKERIKHYGAELLKIGGVLPESYHDWLWRQFQAQVQLGDAVPSARERIDGQVADAFGRFYGFGERLRWPKLRGAGDALTIEPKSMMIVQPQLPPSDDEPTDTWFVTNAVSLAGQVFRLDGVTSASADAARILTHGPTVQGRPLLAEPVASPGTDYVEDHRRRIATAVVEADRYAADPMLRWFGTIVDGRIRPRVWYLPREARCQPTSFSHQVAGAADAPLYAVPGALLDALEPAARVDLTPRQDGKADEHNMIVLNPQRVLIRAPELRNAADIENGAVGAFIHVKLELRRAPVTSIAAGTAYEMRFSGAVHADDAAFIARCIAGASTDPNATLWIETTVGGVMTPRQLRLTRLTILAVGAEGDRPMLVVHDPQDELRKLLPLSPTPRPDPNANAQAAPQPTQRGALVDLVCDASHFWIAAEGAAGKAFNLLTARAGDATADPASSGPMLTLAKHFNHAVGLSTDRILERFGLSLTPPPPATTDTSAPTDQRPLLAQFMNFNKLRLDLLRSDGTRLILTHRDALLPLMDYPGGIAADDPVRNAFPWMTPEIQFCYWLVHQFTQEVTQSPADAEKNRYQAYGSAGEPLRLVGRVEHQYGYRVPVSRPQPIQLPHTSDIRHLAVLALPWQGAASNLGSKERLKQQRPAVTFDHRIDAPGKPEFLELSLNQDYFRAAYERFAHPESPQPTASDEPKVQLNLPVSPASLREVYEALFDLQTGLTTLTLEAWNFDNTERPTLPEQIADPDLAVEYPGILAHLSLDGIATRDVTGSFFGGWFQLLGSDFDAFVGRLEAAIANDTAEPWRALHIDLTTTDWHWEYIGGARTADVSKWANIVRLGLDIRRPAARTIQPADIDMNLAEDRRERCQFVALGPVQDPPSLVACDPTAPDAQADLLHYVASSALHPSPLVESRAWVVSNDRDFDGPDRGPLLFADPYPFLNFPTQVTDPVADVTEVFYVPYAFLPLPTHAELGDTGATLEFAEYTTAILGALRSGQANALNDLIGVQPATADIAWRQRVRVLDLITRANGVADRLHGLLRRVEPQMLPAGLVLDTPMARRKAELYTTDVPAALRAADKFLRRAQRALLVADPSVFGVAKAIATGVFAERSFSRKLHSVEIRKHIRQVASVHLPDFDTDRFTFARVFGTGASRFVIDVLDDQSYDVDFEIAQNEYASDKPYGTVRGRKEVAKRGDVLARTAEDVIENHHLFADRGDPVGSRSLEATAIHYNPLWDHERYLLPSRSFPRQPSRVSPDDITLRQQILTPDEILKDSVASVDLESLFQRQVDAAMKNVVSLPLGGEVLELRRRGSIISDPKNAEGWWYADGYASVYYFIVEPDPDDPDFVLDTFHIEVERSRTVHGFDESAGAAPVVVAAPAIVASPLLDWFRYFRRREETRHLEAVPDGGQTGTASTSGPPLSTPLSIQLGTLVDELESWLVGARALLPETPVARPAATAPSMRTVESGGSTLKLSSGVLAALPADPAATIGGVIAADLLERPASATGQRVLLLRLLVLDDVWKHTRVRLRIARNEASGIDPAFTMFSDISQWANYTRNFRRLRGASQIPAQARTLRVDPLHTSLDAWLASNNSAHDFGPVLTDAFTARFRDSVGTNRTFWNTRELLDTGPIAGKRSVSGEMLLVIRDQFPRSSVKGPEKQGIPERGDELTKQILHPVDAARLEFLVRPSADAALPGNDVRSDLVHTVAPSIRIVWASNESGAPEGSHRPVDLFEITLDVRFRNP